MELPVLAIDPGTACGWALRWPDGRFDSGVWWLAPRKGEGPGARYNRLRSEMVELFAARPFGVIYFEQVQHHAAVRAAHVYGGLVAVIQAFGEKRGIPYRPVYVAQAKALATGKVHCDKVAMLAAARARWPGWDFEDDNEADARWIAEAGAQGGVQPVKKLQRKKRAKAV